MPQDSLQVTKRIMVFWEQLVAQLLAVYLRINSKNTPLENQEVADIDMRDVITTTITIIHIPEVIVVVMEARLRSSQTILGKADIDIVMITDLWYVMVWECWLNSVTLICWFLSAQFCAYIHFVPYAVI